MPDHHATNLRLPPQELLVSPQLLDQNSIPYVKLVQHPREFIITFPGARHRAWQPVHVVRAAARRPMHVVRAAARRGLCMCSRGTRGLRCSLHREGCVRVRVPVRHVARARLFFHSFCEPGLSASSHAWSFLDLVLQSGKLETRELADNPGSQRERKKSLTQSLMWPARGSESTART